MSKYKLDKIITLRRDTSEAKIMADKVSLLAEKIFERRPTLFEVLLQEGECSLWEYTKSSQQYHQPEIFSKRRNDIINSIYKKTRQLFGTEIAKEALPDLKKVNSVPTADHHGPLAHPFFLNSNLVNALTRFDYAFLNQEKLYLLTLASSSVSLNNSSYPKGLIFHAKDKNGEIREHKIPLLPKSKRMTSVYSVRPYGKREIDQANDIINKKVKRGEFSENIGEQLHEVIDSIYDRNDVLCLPNYKEQISKTNYFLWQTFFSSSLSLSVENLYLDLESFINDLLLSYHLKSDSPIARLMFDPDVRQLGLKLFENLDGIQSVKQNRGTAFFWAMIKDKRVQLTVDGNRLISADRSVMIPLEPDFISQALQDKLIMPNLLICFLLLSGYYGINCLGGFSQVHYLTVMMEKWRDLLNQLGEKEELEANMAVPTTMLYGDMSLVFLSQGPDSDKAVPASFLDLLLYQRPRMREDLCQAAKDVSLAESIILHFPEFYPILYSDNERNPVLAEINREDMLKVVKFEATKYYTIIL